MQICHVPCRNTSLGVKPSVDRVHASHIAHPPTLASQMSFEFISRSCAHKPANRHASATGAFRWGWATQKQARQCNTMQTVIAHSTVTVGVGNACKFSLLRRLIQHCSILNHKLEKENVKWPIGQPSNSNQPQLRYTWKHHDEPRGSGQEEFVGRRACRVTCTDNHRCQRGVNLNCE